MVDESITTHIQTKKQLGFKEKKADSFCMFGKSLRELRSSIET